jgi:hypothetical protein
VRRPHVDREQEGQVIPALLLLVVALLFVGLAFSQVGSAGDQGTQVQTAADSAAVADAHVLRTAGISRTVHTAMPATFAFGAAYAADVPVILPTGLLATACNAANSNWSSNPHQSGLNCGEVQVAAGAGTAAVTVTAPAGEIADRPLDVQGVRPHARATATVVLTECPAAAGATPEGTALAHWIAQTTAATFGGPSPICLTPQDEKLLADLALLPPAAQLAAVGPPVPTLDAVTRAFRVQIID